MLYPKKTKYKKIFKFKGCFERYDYSLKATTLQYGLCGLQAMENGRLSPKQVEAVRRIIVKKMIKRGRVYIGLFCDLRVTKKPSEVRMGSGKGSFSYWVTKVNKGRVFFEIIGRKHLVPLMTLALLGAIKKLPIKSRIIYKIL